jgi:hypothetical protein
MSRSLLDDAVLKLNKESMDEVKKAFRAIQKVEKRNDIGPLIKFN